MEGTIFVVGGTGTAGRTFAAYRTERNGSTV
jgi:hypothetical protein